MAGMKVGGDDLTGSLEVDDGRIVARGHALGLGQAGRLMGG
jgi:hypothetical protein